MNLGPVQAQPGDMAAANDVVIAVQESAPMAEVAARIDNFIFAGSLVFLALAGSKAQEIKKRKLMGVEWDAWLRR